jgi:hypothetical protein
MHPGEATAEIDPAVSAGWWMIVIVAMVVIVIVRVSMRMPVIVAAVVMGMIMRMAVIMIMMVRVIMAVAAPLSRVDACVPASAHRTHQSTSSSLTRSSSPAVTCN